MFEIFTWRERQSLPIIFLLFLCNLEGFSVYFKEHLAIRFMNFAFKICVDLFFRRLAAG